MNTTPPMPMKGGACFDTPDVRDWKPKEMFGDSTPPDRFEHVNMINIRTRKQTLNNCTSQALGNVIMIMKRLGDYDDKSDNLWENLDGDIGKLWENQHNKIYNKEGEPVWGTGTADIQGDSLQNSLKTSKYTGIPILIGSKWINVKIKGYFKIENDEVKTYLRKGYPVYTGWDWVYKKRKNGILSSTDDDGFLWEKEVGDKYGGHCVCITGIQEDSYQIFNSHGEKWGKFKNGTALISQRKLEQSYTKYCVELDWDQIRKDLNN